MLVTLKQYVDRIVWGSRLGRGGMPARALITVMRYLYALTRDIISGQITLRAMSLVYTTLLSVVPLIAFSFSVLKGFGVHKSLEPLLYNFLLPLGDRGAEITTEVIALVDNVKGGLLGGISLAFFIYTALSMVQKIESSFNYVWHVDKPRSVARRFTEYFSVLLIGPLVMTIALGMIASIRSNQFVQMLIENDVVGSTVVRAGQFMPYVLVAMVFTFLYKFMPNTRVRLRSALVGGLTAGVIWASMSAFFASFILYATRTQLIYSGFAVAITTLIWLYINWLVLLLGAQIAFYHQQPAFLRIGRREPQLSNAMRERVALNVMLLVGRAFQNSDSTVSFHDLSRTLEIPTIALAPIVGSLEDAGLLTATESEQMLPGRDISRIRIADILAVVRQRGETGSYKDPVWSGEVESLCEELDNAITAVVADRTLAQVLAVEPQAAET